MALATEKKERKKKEGMLNTNNSLSRGIAFSIKKYEYFLETYFFSSSNYEHVLEKG